MVSKRGFGNQLARGGLGSIIIKTTNSLLGLTLAVVLARALGPDGYGIYAYMFALVSIMAIPAQFGLPNLVIRETAKAHAKKEWGNMLGVWRWSQAFSVSLCMGIIAVASSIVYILDFISGIQLYTFLFGLILIPFMALTNLLSASVVGLRHVVHGQLPSNVIRPGLLIIFIVLLDVGLNKEITADMAMGLHVTAAMVSLMASIWILAIHKPSGLKENVLPKYEFKAWFVAAWPLALTAGMQQINTNTDLIMLGLFVSADEVGIYRVAAQGGMLVVFGLQTIAVVVSPYITRLYTEGNMQQLQTLVSFAARVSIAIALPIGIAFLLWGEVFIELLFGKAYIGAYMPLSILALGQLVNALFGPVGVMLNMTNNERKTARGVLIAAIMNIVFNSLLIPLIGLNGAALATSMTLLVWNFLLWKEIKSSIGVNSLPFYGVGSRV